MRAGRVGEGELVEGQALAASSDDASTSSLGEAESANLHLGDDDEALIVQDSTFKKMVKRYKVKKRKSI